MIARKLQDPFAYYLASGISLMIAIQSVFNFAVVTGLVPTKGLPLPFISYGGSSLVISMIAAGLLLNVSRFMEGTNQASEVLHVRSRQPERMESDNGTAPKVSQYTFGRGYGQCRPDDRRKSGFFRKSSKRP